MTLGHARFWNRSIRGCASVAEETAKLWRRHHLTYDQAKHVVARARHDLLLTVPRARRRAVERLDRTEVAALIDAAYRRSSRHGLVVKTLFYTGARVSEFVHIHASDLYSSLDPLRIYPAHAKGGSDGYVPILPALAQELQTHLDGRRRGYLFESKRGDKYTPRYTQLIVREAANQARIEKQVTPHRLRASVATILLDAGMPLEHVQMFLRHKRNATTQIYAETSLSSLPRRDSGASSGEGAYSDLHHVHASVHR